MRVGPSRPREVFDELAMKLEDAWYEVVGKDGKEKELRCVLINGGRVAGRESGFVISAVGQEGNWMRENLGLIEKRAMEGDDEMLDLLEELGRRDDL